MRQSTTILLLSTLASFSVRAQSTWPTDVDNNQITPSTRSAPKACLKVTPVVTKDSIGPIRPGMSLSQLRTTCRNLRYGWFGGDEGIFVPVVQLRLGEANLLLEFADTLATSPLSRIITASDRIRTVESFGNGTPIGDIAKLWGKPSIEEAECVLWVLFKSKPGLSFRVQVPEGWDCGDLERLDDNALAKSIVREIVVFHQE